MRFRPCLHILIVLIYSFCFSQSELDWNFNSEGFSNEVIFPVESLYETESGFENLPIGSLIGIFYVDENSNYQCAGYSSYAGDDTNVTIYGDNPETSEIDGLSESDQFYYFLRIQQGGNSNDYLAIDVEYYPDFQIPGFPSFSNDTFNSTQNQTTFIQNITFIPFFSSENNLEGCMNQSSCTYNPNATIHNSEDCFFAIDFFPLATYTDELGNLISYVDCDGNCLIDTDDDGVCDLNEITGCMDPEADNYQEYFTDPGNCWYLGCTNPTALNYDPEATQYQQNSCIFEEFELDWNYYYTDPTSNATFAIDNNITGLDYEGEITLGGFYLDDNSLYSCGGSAIVPDQTQPYSVLTLWGDDSQTEIKDGFNSGEEILFLVLYNGVEYVANAVFANQSEVVDENGNVSYVELPNFTNEFQSQGIYFIEEIQVVGEVQFGCTDSNYIEYDESANLDDGTCLILSVYGCLDPIAFNYDLNANINQVSFEDISDPCLYIGCTDPGFLEYWSYDPINATLSDPIVIANLDDGSCENLIVYGCTEFSSLNYNVEANVNDDSCIELVLGCIDENSFNFNSDANFDDGSCCYISGCTNPDALNFNEFACFDDGSCVSIIEGCTIPSMFNYNPDANVNDGSCIPFIYGCTDETACNYDSTANTDNDSCTFIDGVCETCVDGEIIDNDIIMMEFVMLMKLRDVRMRHL